MSVDKREPPLRIGNIVRLDIGGPAMMVVDDADPRYVTCAWRDGKKVREETFLRHCVRRTAVV